MKLLRNFSLGVIALVLILFFILNRLNAGQGTGTGTVINFYNWGDYIDPELLAQFEEETGYTVIYETFDSNEAMLTKVQQGGTAYDLIVPSEYMVEVMMEADLLQPLDLSQISNLQHYDERFMDLDFDPGNQYSLPYFWGTLGIVYNESALGEGAINDWEDLWNKEFQDQILMIDGAREVIGIGLSKLGYSLNETDDQRLVEAANEMKALMPNVLALVTDEIKMHIANEESAIAVTFSGEAQSALYENEDLVYVVPESGSNFWFDNLAIPKDATNPEGAHALIDFLSDPEVAAQNAEYIGYATPNATAFALMDPEITSDEAFYPTDEVISQLEVYRNLGKEKLIQYNDLYLEVKIEPRD